MALIQYLKDTRSELNHVAWPTRVQTVIFTVLVILLSAVIALYLGFFDYIFTTGLGEVVKYLPQSSVPAAQEINVDDLQLAPLEEGAPAETPAQ